MSIKPQLRST